MPDVSVIIGVRNAAHSVGESVTGILEQSFTDLECIVINDGSVDDTGRILDELAKQDQRLKILHQENRGLTQALITASGMAQGEFIARQDADDISIPDRLEKQVAALARDESAVLATCWVEDVTPEGIVCETHRNLDHTVKLASGEDHHLIGVPAHGSVLMRRDALERVGGYRVPFYYAQDSDLWLRLSEIGNFVVVPEVLYQRTVSTDCISARFQDAQKQFSELAQACFRATRQGAADHEWLREAERLSEKCRVRKDETTSSFDRATSLLLVGAALAEKDPILAGQYFKRAIASNAFHLRAWKALLAHNLRQLFPRDA